MAWPKGTPTWNKGLTYKLGPRSDETRLRISQALTGRTFSDEHRAAISASRRGHEYTKKPDEAYFTAGSSRRGRKMYIRLTAKLGWPEECFICGLGNEWNDLPLTLQVDHINHTVISEGRITMPQPAPATPTAPTTTPTRTPSPYPNPDHDPDLWPDEICPQQRREHASPDVSP